MSKPLLMIASNIRILESVRQQYKKTHDLLSSQYSYELLLQFLHKSQSTTVLGIINEHINFQVSPGQPNSISDDAEAVTLTGSSQDIVSQINQKEIHWGIEHVYTRHMLRDISCNEKNLDLRLDLCTKRTVTTFTDDDLESLKFLINSARC
ncbi:transcription initiation factor TFIID subunit 5-like isoform X1 [Humulus lupulus]|uniref:transcription initiation factor TFIID subunit 5-like isoform X1 n=1 Tax=Humulus lupulus TaxID=3486 RepID=UPI002B40BB2A|nr:transcription initiation factor TFIID subunit 5-like isoform X1 [Humulus lupulus]